MRNYKELCERLLKDSDEILKEDKRFYMLKEICLREYTNKKLVVPIGKIRKNEYVYLDFTSVSGLFIGGATGTGKSIMIDDMIITLMLKNKQDDVKFIFLEPYGIELGEYSGIDYIYNKRNVSTRDKNGKVILERVIKLMDNRTNSLIDNKLKSIQAYNRVNKEKWPHLFIFIDEGFNLMKNYDVQNILDKMLDYGEPLGLHLIYATNSYLKDYSSFLNRFKYRMSFDMASAEQAKYIDIEEI